MARPGRKPRLTAAQQESFARDWNAKLPTAALMARYGISQPTVYDYRVRLGLAHRRPECIAPKRPARTYRPRATRPEPQTFPFRWFPPKQVKAKAWRCQTCFQRSTTGPACAACRNQQGAAA